MLKKLKDNRKNRKGRGQVSLEFSFCMMVVFMMVYGLFKVFHWSGEDLANRRIAYEETLVDQTEVVQEYTDAAGYDSFLRQIDPYFYYPQTMNALWPEDL